MTNRKKETLTEVWLRRLKNNPLVATLIILSLAVAGISAFTESTSKIYQLLFQPQKQGREQASPVNSGLKSDRINVDKEASVVGPSRDNEKYSAAVPPTYTVEIETLPVTVNHGARRQPHSVTLELHSEKDTQRIVTTNYPIRKLFVWSPKISDDVVLTISVGDIILSRRYPGHLGFPEFLREFHTGNRVFRINEFSAEESAILKEYEIEFLSVSFLVRGGGPVAQYLSQ